MLLAPTSVDPTLYAPSVSADRAANRLTIDVQNGALFSLLPALLEKVLETGDYEPGMEVLIDCRRCQHRPGTATIRGLAETLSDLREVRGPVAILAPDERVFGMGRLLEILVGMRGMADIRVFDAAPELESWLRRTAIAQQETRPAGGRTKERGYAR